MDTKTHTMYFRMFDKKERKINVQITKNNNDEMNSEPYKVKPICFKESALLSPRQV